MLYLEGIPKPTDSAQCHATGGPIYGCLPSVCPRCCNPKQKVEPFKSDLKHGCFLGQIFLSTGYFFSDELQSFLLNLWFRYIFTICIRYTELKTSQKVWFSFWRWQETMGLFQFRICFLPLVSSRCSSLRAHVTPSPHSATTQRGRPGEGKKRAL